MTLALYGHPFSSCTQKVLIALYENATPFGFREIGPDTPGHLAHPGPVRLIPEDPLAALDVQFLDRFFDLHMMDAMQVTVDGKLGRLPMKSEEGHALARQRPERVYGRLGTHLAGRVRAAGDDYTMADCAASSSLFYAGWVHRIPDAYPLTQACRARLPARPYFARTDDEARYFRPNFPLGAPDRD